MSRSRRLLMILLSVVTLVACGSGPQEGFSGGGGGAADAWPRGPGMGMGMGRMMGMMGNMPDGVAPGELPASGSPGARLVARYCSQCHGIPTPQRLSAQEWTPTLRRMVVRMERMSRMPMRPLAAPSRQEAETILRYLEEHALRTAAPGSLPTDAPGARLFEETCSRCHALPDPAQHTAREWPAVVDRMRENMRRMEVDGMTDAQTRQIVEYLQGNGRGEGAGAPGALR